MNDKIHELCQNSESHFTCTVFSNGSVHTAWFSVPFMRFVDGLKMGRYIFDSCNRVATRLMRMNGPDLILKFFNRMNGAVYAVPF